MTIAHPNDTAPPPAYRTRLPRWPWLTITGAVFGLIGFAAGATATSDADPKLFVPAVQDAYPETDGHAEDLLGYGYAVCAGLGDGRSEADVAEWLAVTPHQHLGIDGVPSEFGETVVELAVEMLCDGHTSFTSTQVELEHPRTVFRNDTGQETWRILHGREGEDR